MVVHCTWEISDGKDLEKAVLWSAVEDDQSDVEDEVQAENCILLMAPSAGTSEYLTVPACQLLLSCEPHQQIQQLSVLSEARVLEVYGHHGEYLKTVRSELLEEVDDMAVFKGDIKFDRPLSLCSIKFACLRSKSEMWLYGVKAKLLKAAASPESCTKIPFGEVEQRLQDMGLTLSDRAECFKRLINCQQQGLIKFTPEDIGAFIQAFKSTNKSPEANQATNSLFAGNNCNKLSDRTAHTLNSGASSTTANEVNNNPVVTRESISTQTEERLSPDALDSLKSHIDDKLKELDDKLWDRMQKRLNEIEAKLMCKLDEVESFVKPQGVK